jgi:hypothetical protein
MKSSRYARLGIQLHRYDSRPSGLIEFEVKDPVVSSLLRLRLKSINPGSRTQEKRPEFAWADHSADFFEYKNGINATNTVAPRDLFLSDFHRQYPENFGQ